MIVFKNQGIIDIRALKTFGLSSKANQDKIGRFGTGLKYATAVIMRHGGEVSITAGDQKYTVGRLEEEFRGDPITSLTLDGQPLPFTTELGKDWEVWMAFRELYSNALDEGGDVSRSDEPIEACGDETIISVDLAAFEAIYFSMEEHFIGRDEVPVWKSDSIEVFEGRSLFVFYRGIAIMKLKKPAAHRYNLLGYVDLTEDRTAKYDWIVHSRIAEALAKTDDEKIASAACDGRNEFEAILDFSEHEGSQTFLGAAVAQGAACNPTASALVRAQLPEEITTATVLSRSQPGGEALSSALNVMRELGADLTKCKFVLAEGISFYGDYDVRNGAIFLNEAIFDNTEKMTVAVIEGFSEVAKGNWMARKLIERCEATL
ncbi:hypothetical protein [uncultured Roseobacter sp.]|uniref:hypothetical protein n=1 Tax=uncultured Roseobacter sp. TaxID=114847 RepID=UPI0026196D60|nr:hypothetical protein [uncultured Roseobacter sp.]